MVQVGAQLAVVAKRAGQVLRAWSVLHINGCHFEGDLRDDRGLAPFHHHYQ
jgi:hypothetical protein